MRAGWQTRLNITVGGCDSVQVVILMFSPLWSCFCVSCVCVCRVYFEYHCQWLQLCYVQAELLHIMTIIWCSLGFCLHRCGFVISCIFFDAFSYYCCCCCFHPTQDISIFFQVLEHLHVVVDISSRNKRGEFEIRH